MPARAHALHFPIWFPIRRRDFRLPDQRRPRRRRQRTLDLGHVCAPTRPLDYAEQVHDALAPRVPLWVEQAHRAIAAGVPLKGLCVWSLLDNFEWDSGYRERFRLVHVDYPTRWRTPKESFDWYRLVILRNGLA